MLFIRLFPRIKLMRFIKTWLIGSFFLFASLQTANAQTPMQQGLYRIEINQTKSSPNNEAQNNKPEIKTFGSYSFSISESLIDFGKIVPTNPLVRKNKIIINSATTKYYLKAYENHQLLSPKSGTIIDTICDDGSCNEQKSSTWKNILAFGFGFRCSGISFCNQQFSDDDSFMQFADSSKYESPNNLMRDEFGKKEIALTYKLNISPKQRPGSYSNSVTYLTLPSY